MEAIFFEEMGMEIWRMGVSERASWGTGSVLDLDLGCGHMVYTLVNTFEGNIFVHFIQLVFLYCCGHSCSVAQLCLTL